MAIEHEIGRIVVDVTANTALLRKQIKTSIEKKIYLDVGVTAKNIAAERAKIRASFEKKIYLDVRVKGEGKGSLAKLVAQTAKAQAEITKIEGKQKDLREQKERAFARRILTINANKNATIKAQDNKARLDQEARDDRSSRKKIERDQKRIDVADEQNRKLALQERRTQDKRLLAQEAFARASERIEQRRIAKIQAIANKPIRFNIGSGLNQFASSLGEFDKFTTRLLRNSLLAFTGWSAGVSLAVGAAAAAALVSFGKMEQAVARASAVFASGEFQESILKFGRSQESVATIAERSGERITKAANKVALLTLFNPREAAEGAQALAQANFSLAETEESLLTVARFAQNEQIGFAEATEQLTGGLKSAGLATKDLTKLTDEFTVSANASNASAKQVAEAFSNQGGAAFASYEQSAEQALAVITLFGRANERGLKAGTSTAIAIREINRAAFDKAPEAFKKYGISLEDANGKAVPFTKTLAELSALFAQTRAERGIGGFVRLKKELGFTEKSFRALQILFPQVQKLGADGLARLVRQLEQSSGATARQASVVNDTLSFQFQNFTENITIAFQKFGKKAGNALSGVFDKFNGPDGYINRITPQVEKLGVKFGLLIEKFSKFIDSPAAIEGAKILVDAIRITLIGVRDTFKAFSAAFKEGDEAQSTFVSFAEAVRGFADLSATVLPKVAEVLGKIVKTLIDNKDSFDLFAKLALGLYLARKAYTLFVQPITSVVELLVNQRKALVLLASAETLSPLKSAMASVASSIGLIGTRAKESTAAIDAMSSANRTALAGSLVPIPAAKAVKPRAAASASAASLLFAGTRFEKLARIMPRIANAIGRATISTARLGSAFARIAGPIGIVIAAIDFGIGVVKGFRESFRGSDKDAKELSRNLAELQPVFEFLKDSGKVLFDQLENILGVVRRVGESFGRYIGESLRVVIEQAADFARIFTAETWTGKLDALKDVFINLLLRPIGLGLGLLIDQLADLFGSFDVKIFGKDLNPVIKGLRKAADETRAWKADYSKVAKESDKVSKTVTNHFTEITKSIAKASGATVDLRNEMEKSNADTIAQQIKSGSSVALSELVDTYRKAAGTGSLAKAIQESLNITRGKARNNLAEAIRRQLEESQQVAFKQFNAKFTASQLKNPSIRPKIDEEAVQTIRAQINNLRDAKHDIKFDTTLAKGQREKLIKKIDAEIKALNSHIVTNPVRIQFEIGGQAIGTGQSIVQQQFVEEQFLGPIRAAIRNPALLAKLTAAQRALFNKVTEGARTQIPGGFSATPDIGGAEINNALRKLEEETQSRTTSVVAPKKVKNDFYKYALAAADGLAEGSKSKESIDTVSNASKFTADVYVKAFRLAMGIFSPSRVMFHQGLLVNQGLAQGIRATSIIPMSAALEAGLSVMRLYADGITIGNASVIAAMTGAITRDSQILSSVGYATALPAGIRYMDGFLTGMKSKMGDSKNMAKGTIAYYLHVTIPALIAELKGPVAYDAGILVPAGEAVMGGFDKGLRRGFGVVEGFLRDVGPSMEEFVPDGLFSDRTKTFMVDVAKGKTPDPYEFYKDLIPESTFSGGGIDDPRLQFLHKTLSMKDTTQMAKSLMKTFGMDGNSLYVDRAAGTLTSSGNVSEHTYGVAADMGTGGPNPTSQSLAMFKALKPLLGNIFHQVIHNGVGYTDSVSNSFPLGQHADHVHASWLRGKGFDKHSGKIGEPAVPKIPGISSEIVDAIMYAAGKTRLDPALIAAVMDQESGFRKNVVSPDGGYGLMQLTSSNLVAAADRLNGRFDPRSNAYVGSKYLADLISQLGSVQLGLSGYNSGPGGGEHSGHVDVPNYVSSVLNFFKHFKKLFGGAREHGGPTKKKKAYLVGEKGPELHIPYTSGTVLNAKVTEKIMASVGDVQNYDPSVKNTPEEAKYLTYLANIKPQSIQTAGVGKSSPQLHAMIESFFNNSSYNAAGDYRGAFKEFWTNSEKIIDASVDKAFKKSIAKPAPDSPEAQTRRKIAAAKPAAPITSTITTTSSITSTRHNPASRDRSKPRSSVQNYDPSVKNTAEETKYLNYLANIKPQTVQTAGIGKSSPQLHAMIESFFNNDSYNSAGDYRGQFKDFWTNIAPLINASLKAIAASPKTSAAKRGTSDADSAKKIVTALKEASPNKGDYYDQRVYNFKTNATDPRAVAAYIEATTRSRIGIVNLR